MYNISSGAIRWQIPDFLYDGHSNAYLFQRKQPESVAVAGVANCSLWPCKLPARDVRLTSFIRQTGQQHLSCVLSPHLWIATRPFCCVNRYCENRRMRYSQFPTWRLQHSTRRECQNQTWTNVNVVKTPSPASSLDYVEETTLQRHSRSCTGYRSEPE